MVNVVLHLVNCCHDEGNVTSASSAVSYIYSWSISFINTWSDHIHTTIARNTSWKVSHNCRLTLYPQTLATANNSDNNVEMLDEWQKIVCHWVCKAASQFIFLADEEDKRLPLNNFRSILCFIMATWNIGLALISLMAFLCESYVQSKSGKALFSALRVTPIPSKDIFSLCVTSAWRKSPFGIKSFKFCIHWW